MKIAKIISHLIKAFGGYLHVSDRMIGAAIIGQIDNNNFVFTEETLFEAVNIINELNNGTDCVDYISKSKICINICLGMKDQMQSTYCEDSIPDSVKDVIKKYTNTNS